MNTTERSHRFRRVWIGLALGFGLAVRADFFSWETGTDGSFTDPNRWHGPNFPEHTRYPGASDDATIDRGPITVTISGSQATRELVTGNPTLQILGTYAVNQLSAYGTPLTLAGGGELTTPLWLMGAVATVNGTTASVGTLQPLGGGLQPSELRITGGGTVLSESLDRSRGALRVVVEGPGSLWSHSSALPFMEAVLRPGGHVEVPSANGIYLDASGGGASMVVAGLFRGYGRVAAGAWLQSSDGENAGGGNTTLDGGRWTVTHEYRSAGGDLFIVNQGILQARDLVAGLVSTMIQVEGAGSRVEISNRLRPLGGIQLRKGGVLVCGTAEFELGFGYAESGGMFSVGGDVFNNSGLNLNNGGLLEANGVFLADTVGRGGGLTVAGGGSLAELRGPVVVGQRGEGTLTVRDGGRLSSVSGGAGVFSGALGTVDVSGSGTAWEIRPTSGGGGLLVGGAGTATMTVTSGATVQVSREALSVLGRESGGRGTVRLYGFASALDLGAGRLVLGERGRGILEMESGARVQAGNIVVGRSQLDNHLIVQGGASLLGATEELVVGEGGSGSLQVFGGAHGIVKRLVIGRESLAENRVVLRDPGTRVTGSGRVDIGEFNGRGILEMSGVSELRPAAGLSVGIYDGSDGRLSVDENSVLATPEDAIIGGGANSKALAILRGGGSLEALDVLVFAKASGAASLLVTNASSNLEAARDLQVGFTRGPVGPTLVAAASGAFVSVGERLIVGNGGRFEVSASRVKVGGGEFPAPGTVRIGPGGRLQGVGGVAARVEVAAGGVVSPGSSPGTLSVQGNYVQQAGGQLEIEIAGTKAGTGYDVLQVSGAATVGGVLKVNFTEGFAPKTGQTFPVLLAGGGITGTFERVEVAGVAPGFRSAVVPDAGKGLSLVAQNDGIPTTVPTLAIESVASNGAILSWPANGLWVLQSAPAVSGPFKDSGVVPVLRDDRYVVTLSGIGTAAYYRLRR
ncbi:MAG: hypothetical protein JNL10_02010 [Verrucomicrobiales bacterium]|nr:hypothetical protein [Verrucomicrobiales bacterium]